MMSAPLSIQVVLGGGEGEGWAPGGARHGHREAAGWRLGEELIGGPQLSVTGRQRERGRWAGGSGLGQTGLRK
jgi:hypothetical protein